MNIDKLGAILDLGIKSTQNTKSLIKLSTIDVLKSLSNESYSVLDRKKTFEIKSQLPLREYQKYWVVLEKAPIPTLLKVHNLPKLFNNFRMYENSYSLKELEMILSGKKSLESIKHNFLEHLGNATTKEEFTNNFNLLLSLYNNIFTLPIKYKEYFSILQFKKRYNKQTKTKQIEFYVALESLGPISGVIQLISHKIEIDLNVAFEYTSILLSENIKDIAYDINISVVKNIEPLYQLKTNSLLDINI